MTRQIVYRSVFAKELRDLVNYKRSLGCKYETEEAAFYRIDQFLIAQNVDSKCLSKQTVDKWCAKRSWGKQSNCNSRISQMRIVCSYLADLGYPVYVPPKFITKHGRKYNAHIYTDDELNGFFEAVDCSMSLPDLCPYREDIMPVFFRILYTSGMRVSELRLLKIRDFDLDHGVIRLVNAKNHKERLVPVHPVLVEKCREIKAKIHVNSSDEEYFFMQFPGRAMTLQNLYSNFRRYLEKAGISHTGKGPRLHDFRHTYCVNLLRLWTAEGRDLLVWLPYMKTMLGHDTFDETAYYLKLTATMYPDIRMKLQINNPGMIEEVKSDEKEFY